ncbi:MAG TPA: sigma-54 dependent transcriptional regulator [Candidatus Dormibacteraeota bacterium]|nr:sigma-54 dependent transcriptional regulator [Candidatus Dormibacteraeota bacterium]
MAAKLRKRNVIPEGAFVMVASPREELRRDLIARIGRKIGGVLEATGGADALAQLDSSPCQVLLLDRRLLDLNPEEMVEILRVQRPDLDVVLLESAEEVEGAEEATTPAEEVSGRKFQEGLDGEESVETVAAECEYENSNVSAEPLPDMLGTTPSMKRVFRLARLVAPRQTAVLITGETGTGKELVARAIHQLSGRAKGPFVVVNCAAIPESLIEAELFGYVRGAFTGAVQSNLGRIHAAHGGTLFLDEAGELPLKLQPKLLRFLQHGEVQRLGSSDVFRVDVRVVAATNAELAKRVASGEFRSDLFYRLAVFPIELPSLRERPDDIIELAESFLRSLAREVGLPLKRFSPDAETLLRRHNWPGNVRQLQHFIERAFILAEDRPEITPEMLHLKSSLPQE